MCVVHIHMKLNWLLHERWLKSKSNMSLIPVVTASERLFYHLTLGDCFIATEQNIQLIYLMTAQLKLQLSPFAIQMCTTCLLQCELFPPIGAVI